MRTTSSYRCACAGSERRVPVRAASTTYAAADNHDRRVRIGVGLSIAAVALALLLLALLFATRHGIKRRRNAKKSVRLSPSSSDPSSSHIRKGAPGSEARQQSAPQAPSRASVGAHAAHVGSAPAAEVRAQGSSTSLKACRPRGNVGLAGNIAGERLGRQRGPPQRAVRHRRLCGAAACAARRSQERWQPPTARSCKCPTDSSQSRTRRRACRCSCRRAEPCRRLRRSSQGRRRMRAEAAARASGASQQALLRRVRRQRQRVSPH